MTTILKTNRIMVDCEVYSYPKSWGHKAKLYYDNILVCDKKIQYFNRTWERFQFETIIQCILTKAENKKYSIPLYEINEAKNALSHICG
jgi:hypothetical protein